MTEIELINGCINNSQIAQKELFYTYYAEMKNLVQFYCVNDDDAKSIVSQGFMDVFLNIKGFNRGSSLKTWIKRIMINRALQFYRKEKLNNERRVSLDKGIHLYIDDVEISESGLQKLEMQDLISLVQSLPLNERTAFTMFVIEGFSHKEIGETLQIAESTSRWYLNNAKKLLKEKLKTLDCYERRGKIKENF